MRICYFGIFDPNFSRSRVIVKGLERSGVEVIIVNDRTPSFKKYVELWRQHKLVKGSYDAMIVGFPGYFTVFLARLLTNKPIIFDAYISYYDGLLDRRSYPKFHPKILYARVVDYMAGLISGSVLTINEQYKKFFIETIHVAKEKMYVLRKGADTDIFHPQVVKVEPGRVFTVGWWGSFIPLHGLEYVIEAAELLQGSDVRFELIGRGQMKDWVASEIKKRDLKNIVLLPPVSYPDLPKAVSGYDLILGIFNNTPKASRCITNKVFEALALGMPIITEDSLANREIFVNKQNVFMVEAGNARALADGIMELKKDSNLRKKIAKGGLDLFNSKFTVEKIGAVLIEIINATIKPLK